MYPVSEEYKQMIKEPSRYFYWTGTIVTKDGREYPFTNEDIVKGSGYITRQCSGSSEIELGTVYAAELGITLFSEIDRYTLEGASITIDFHLQLQDESIETVPMGIFYVAEANRRIKTLEIKAYDAMLNLDKNFNKGLSSAYPYDFLTHLSKACKVELAQTKEEIEALTNGTELFGIYQENDIESWRDFLFYLAQALGCFATIDRAGKLLLLPYTNIPSKVIDSRHRFSSSFSDFVTRYTAISSTNRKTETAEYYAKDPDDGLTMNLGVNPLLQFGLDETRKRILNGILDAISIVEYVPFDSDTIGDPALDLGDVLKFTGGHADEFQHAAITSITTKVNGKQSIKCVGKNPRLAEAKSKNDKNIAGLISSINETRLSIYTFVNALPVDVGEERVSIINMEFASADETNAEFHAQCILQVSSNPDTRNITASTEVDLGEEDATVISFPLSWQEDGKSEITVYYILDGHEIAEFHPKESWLSGNHLLNLYYPIIELEENQLHTFEVQLSMQNGTGHIDAQDALATISGQGLGAQERWDGRITVDETMRPITLAGMRTHRLGDYVGVHFITPTPKGVSDRMGSITLTGLALPTIQERISLFSPIVHDIVETADKAKMAYSRKYVLDDEVFNLRNDYEITGGTQERLNRGRMTRLVISTENFSSLTSITVLPFETQPFVNNKTLEAGDLQLTDFVELKEEGAVLKTSFFEVIYGTDVEIDRGRLASFNLGLSNMETIDELEVTNV